MVALRDTKALQFTESSHGLTCLTHSDDKNSSFSIPGSLTTLYNKAPFVLEEFVDAAVLSDIRKERFGPWQTDFTLLLPVKTPADYNCLCHSTSIALWGAQVW